jgi:hypothetical protein
MMMMMMILSTKLFKSFGIVFLIFLSWRVAQLANRSACYPQLNLRLLESNLTIPEAHLKSAVGGLNETNSSPRLTIA